MKKPNTSYKRDIESIDHPTSLQDFAVILKNSEYCSNLGEKGIGLNNKG